MSNTSKTFKSFPSTSEPLEKTQGNLSSKHDTAFAEPHVELEENNRIPTQSEESEVQSEINTEP